MWGIAAVVAFAVALILHLASIAKGILNTETFVIAGLICLALHLVLAGPKPAFLTRG